MMKKSRDCELAKDLLNAIWKNDVTLAKCAILDGANPNWIMNGHPFLIHAVFNRNVEMTMLLINHGATQKEEALGFALENGIGELVLPLMFLGIVPKAETVNEVYGALPSRYAPLDLEIPTHML